MTQSDVWKNSERGSIVVETMKEITMPTMSIERRSMPRFRVQFRTTFSSSTVLEQNWVVDLSLGGCRVESTTSVSPSLSVELQIHVPGHDSPLMIDGATVQWVREGTFGVGCLQLRETEQDRLRQVITRMARDEDS